MRCQDRLDVKEDVRIQLSSTKPSIKGLQTRNNATFLTNFFPNFEDVIFRNKNYGPLLL